MSCVWVTSDWHLGGKNMLKYRSHFASVEEHDNTILENYLTYVKKRDIVWFLGDIAMTHEALLLIQELPARKKLVLGNHCTDKKVKVIDLIQVFESIHGLVNYKKAWLSHAPVSSRELRGKFNVHGHVHAKTLPDTRYFNACLENTDYKPIKYQEVLERLQA